MEIAYLTHYDIKNPQQWHPKTIGVRSTSAYKAKALHAHLESVQYIGPFPEKTLLSSKIKNRIYQKLFKQTYHAWTDLKLNRLYGQQMSEALASVPADFVVCPDINSTAFLRCPQPIVLWTTNPYAAIIESYPEFSQLCAETQQSLVKMDRLALQTCDLAIFASQWAAQFTIETYGIKPEKVKVVPYGANVISNRTVEDIQQAIATRQQDRCELLFLGVNWQRKGGDIALRVAERLNAIGLNARLTIVGCSPPHPYSLPDFVNVVGFINKGTPEGIEKLERILWRSHFLILPSQAETFGNVLCEANSFAIPCLATQVGGIPTIIRDGINGQLFSLQSEIEDYCQYIRDRFQEYPSYQQLALSSFQEYQTRLNWSVAGQVVKNILLEIKSQSHVR
jgi:glycosyltransferase involved in cell wall biosynthesis